MRHGPSQANRFVATAFLSIFVDRACDLSPSRVNFNHRTIDQRLNASGSREWERIVIKLYYLDGKASPIALGAIRLGGLSGTLS